MFDPADYPFLILLGSLAAFWLSSSVGCWLGKRTGQIEEPNREDFKFVLGGTLTLLGLIIGFTFSMAVERYNQRKNYEEEEANAIGTEMSNLFFERPILNSPYAYPGRHWELDADGQPTNKIIDSRRKSAFIRYRC